MIDAVGTEAIGPSGLVSLGMTFSWAGDLRTMVMASAINGLKLADIGQVRGRLRCFGALMLSIVVGLAGSIWMVVWNWGISTGASIWTGGSTTSFGEIVHGDSAYKIANPRHPLNDFGEIGAALYVRGDWRGDYGAVDVRPASLPLVAGALSRLPPLARP